MKVLKEYHRLYTDDYFIADLWGGRAGARSHGLTQYSLYNLLNKKNSRAFFLRETHKTIYKSLWADFKDRIQEYQDLHSVSLSKIIQYTDNKQGENNVVNLLNGNTISTKGFQVSDNEQTASLKSLAGATDIYIDEFDEVSKEDFDKLKLSLRKKGTDLKIIRAFNPPFSEHTIWKDYQLIKVNENELIKIVKKHTDQPIGVIENLVRSNNKTYQTAIPKNSNHISIYSSFINNYENLNPTAIKEYDKYLIEDFHYFCTNIIGLISNTAGEVVFNDYSLNNYSFEEVKDSDILHVGMDFNITRMQATVRVQRGKEKHLVDEFVDYYDTSQLCEAIKKRYPYNRIIVTSDASGKSRSTSGSSDWDIIRSFKFGTKDLRSNPRVRDRINTINTEFRQKLLFINKERCPSLHKSLTLLKYKNGEPDKTSGLDHIIDAFSYDVFGEVNLGVKNASSYVIELS